MAYKFGELTQNYQKSYTRKWHDEFDSSVNILLIIFEMYHVLHVCFPNYILTKMDQNSNDYLRNAFLRLL